MSRDAMHEKRHTQAEAAADALVPCSIDSLPTELVVAILSHVADVRSIGRCAAVSRRLSDVIARDPERLVWRRAAEQAAARCGLVGPWLAVAAKDKGWPWVRGALEPLRDCGSGVGFERHASGTLMGEFDGHDLHGYAVLVVPGRDWCCGRWKRGVRHGRATVAFADGERYEGDWRHDAMHGRGAATFANGNTYEGEWRNGKREGRGTYRWAAGNLMYEGEWADDKRHGDGTERHRGTIIEGQFRHDMRHGRFSVRRPNGDVFECSYHDDVAQGCSRLVCSPDCPDASFRSMEIASRAWVHVAVRGEGPSSALVSYPDPVSSPKDFSDFYRYFTSGLMYAPDAFRHAIGGVLSEAARQAGSATPAV